MKVKYDFKSPLFLIILFSFSLSFVPSQKSSASSLSEQIAQFHNGTKKLTLVQEDQKNLAAKHASAKKEALFAAIKEKKLRPLSERLKKEQKLTPISGHLKKEKNKHHKKSSLTFLSDLQKKHPLKKVTQEIQKLDWEAYRGLKKRIERYLPEVSNAKKNFLDLNQQKRDRKNQLNRLKEKKSTFDILIQKFSRLRDLNQKNILYSEEKREVSDILQKLELEENTSVEDCEKAINLNEAEFSKVEKDILLIETEIKEIEKSILHNKKKIDSFDRDSKRLFLTLEDFHNIEETSLPTLQDKNFINSQCHRLSQAVERLGGSLIFSPQGYSLDFIGQKVCSQEITLFFNKFDTLNFHLNKNLNLDLFQRLLKKEKSHDFVFENDRFFLKKRQESPSVHISAREHAQISSTLIFLNTQFTILHNLSYTKKAQLYFGYTPIFKGDKINFQTSPPFTVDRFRKIHTFLLMNPQLSDLRMNPKLSDTFTGGNLLADTDSRLPKGEEEIILPQDEHSDEYSIDLLGSIILLDIQNIGDKKKEESNHQTKTIKINTIKTKNWYQIFFGR